MSASKAITAGAVDRGLRELGALDLEIEAVGARMLKALDRVKAEHEPDLQGLRARRGKLAAKLEEACRAARSVLFPPGCQTLKLGFGQVSFRGCPDSLDVAEGQGEEDVAIRLLKGGMAGFVRIAHRLDRDALRKALETGEVKERELARLGIRRVPGGEVWRVKPDHEAVREAVGKV